MNDDCLATLDQWKIAAPTAKTPWVIATRLLRESGKIEEAIETTRRALARFSGDEDFSANLAGLYRQIGENSEAERIFWRLYDQAPYPTAQSRWAARLSDLARSTGATAELKEKFTARARSNSRSLGPILALVELARTANDKKAISEHLAQALRIKPSDTGIRLQLAQAEANAGNSDTQIEVLSEGVANDPAGRVRNALAQAYIGRGEIMKGMRMLRALAGERGSDPRSVEQATISLARTGMLAEAIQYLGEALPDGGDWHSRFLLATLLTQDGREREAIHVFLSLLDVENEIPGLAHNPNSRHQSNFSGYLRNSNQLNLSIQPTAETTLNQLLSAVRQDRHSYGPRRGRNPYTLPTSAP